MDLLKYGYLPDANMDSCVQFIYKNEYAIEKTTGDDRLIVSPEKDHIKMMLDLMEDNNPCKYFILYVLLISRCDNELGRYQIANPLTWNELKQFCYKYTKYIETDGRHHFWIMNYDTKDIVVYDHHNVLYVYENLKSKINILENKNYKKIEKIRFVVPHTHYYNKENDSFENEIVKNHDWIITPLREQDEYR